VTISSGKVVVQPFPHLMVHTYWRKMQPFNLQVSLKVTDPQKTLSSRSLAKSSYLLKYQFHSPTVRVTQTYCILHRTIHTVLSVLFHVLSQ